MADLSSGRHMSKVKPKAPEIIILPSPKCELCIKGSSEEFPLIDTDVTGKFAHKVCALHILEPQVETDPVTKKERVVGLRNIPKGRWKLKCSVCRMDPKLKSEWIGACIQCSRVKDS